MLKNSPSYEKGSFSGILTAGKNGEIWIIGKKISSKIYPGTYIGVKNTSGEYFAKISPIIRYTAQKGDDLINSKPDYIEAKGILTGDDVAMRTTFADNLALALEIRKLTREPAPD